MTKLSISEVSKRWGVSRPTLYRYRDQGKLSFEKEGRRVVIDVSEAIRALGQPVSQDVKEAVSETVSSVMSSDKVLETKVEFLERQLADVKESLTHARKAEEDLRAIIDRQTRLLEDGSRPVGWWSRLLGR